MKTIDITICTCKNCGSSNVEIRAWINQETGNSSGETGYDADTWCNDCEKHDGVNIELDDKEVEDRKFIEHYLLSTTYSAIGIYKPENHDQIVDFILEDVKDTADPKEWHSGDVDIAFRRFLESKR